VSDKFGDYGLCGIAGVAQVGDQLQIVDFLLSCRVMGRGVEETMLATIIAHARTSGCQRVWADYVPSAKNEPIRKWLQSVSHDWQGSRVSFQTSRPFSAPRHATVTLTGIDEEITA
jgi:FkbH-like protein